MSPKEQFLETPHAAEHRKTVQTQAFREALNYAMLEFTSHQNFNAAELAVSGARVSGAQDFCAILKNLATVATVPQGTQPQTINYNVYDQLTRAR